MNQLVARLLLIATTFVPLICFAQESDSTDADAEAKRGVVNIEPYTGPPIFLDEGDPPVPARVVEEKQYRDYHDEAKTQIKTERTIAKYSDGSIKTEGRHREFYADGQVFVEGQFANGVPVGKWVYYHTNGQIAKKLTYVDGEAEGELQLFRADGSLKADRAFTNGKRNGTWKTYAEDGEQLLSEQVYVNGELDGTWKVWFDNGQLRQENNFKAGVRDGISKEWDREGTLRGEVPFVDGKKQGTVRIWSVDGQVIEQEYEADKLISTKRDE